MEERQNEEINFPKEENVCKLATIKRQFKRFVGYYVIYSAETHPEAFNEIIRVIKSFESKFKNNFALFAK